jgi:hypothetical protein
VPTLQPFIETKQEELQRLCALHRVRRLDLFGSATQESFDPRESDLDFLVEFDEAPPGHRADQYFQFREDLQTLFGRPVDLVMVSAVKNPYLRQSIERSRVPLYV